MGDGSGLVARILQAFPVKPCVADEQMLENVRSAVARDLPSPALCSPHDTIMSIAAGGPSLNDTWPQLDGVVCAVNGSLNFLLDRGVTPWAVGCMDPRPHMAETLGEPRDDVFYFLGSTCHPSVFEKFAGKQVICWHPLGMTDMREAIGKQAGIGGGTTMGLRWLTLGHYMGFRNFHGHGLDSSFRGKSTHAYPDWRDKFDATMLEDSKTSLNFLQQVHDWFEMKAMFRREQPWNRINTKLFGEGLLQHCEAGRLKEVAAARASRRPDTKPLRIVCVNAGDYLGRGDEYVAHLESGLERHVTGPFTFDVLNSGPSNWWAKLELFRPGRFPAGERILYFDLDTVICGPIDDLIAYDGPFTMLDDWMGVTPMNSSVMSWTAGECDHIWNAWVEAGKPTDSQGDQAWIGRCVPDALRWQELFPDRLVSFKAHCSTGVPADARAICFHGEPRPHLTELW